jgi:hypothetical protein
MKTFTYNDIEFTIAKAGNGWEIARKLADGRSAQVGAGLFPGVPDGEAEARAYSLVKTVFPVGVKSVGPDVAHPNMVGDLKIVGPDVAHPNFIYWNKDSTSFAR